MRVLYLTNVPAPYRVEFFNLLSEKCDLTVAFEMEGAKNRNKNWKSAEEYRFKAVFLKSVIKTEEGAFCPEVRKVLKAFRNDVIIIGGYSTYTGMYAISFLKRKHIPFVLNCDGGMIKQDGSIKRIIKSYFIGAASYWLCAGEVSKPYLVHYGANQNRILSYNFGSVRNADITTPLCKDERDKLRKSLGISEQRMILYVGSFIERKGVDVLIKAARKLTNTALVLVGGDNLKPYDSLIDEEMKCKIYSPGFKNKKEIGLYYRAADIFVLPTREDIWGLVVNEAMAYGLPVITTRKCNSGVEMINDNYNGFLVDDNSVEQLEDKINYVFGLSEKELSDISSRAIERCKEYTIEKMVEQHIKRITEICAER